MIENKTIVLSLSVGRPNRSTKEGAKIKMYFYNWEIIHLINEWVDIRANSMTITLLSPNQEFPNQKPG